MLCARECPDWCIYIDSHKEELPPTTQGGRARQRNVLDRFAIDFSLCMYCGICVEVCPFDALSGARSSSTPSSTSATCSTRRTGSAQWMPTVPAARPAATRRVGRYRPPRSDRRSAGLRERARRPRRPATTVRARRPPRRRAARGRRTE